MLVNHTLIGVILRLMSIAGMAFGVGCATSFYKTNLSSEQRSLICSYSVPWERQECLDEANEQIEWCKEALGQEDDCWNTLLGEYSRYRKEFPVDDAHYFAILHDPSKIAPLLAELKHRHPSP